MPLTLPENLPAIEVLRQENIFVTNSSHALGQNMRPMRIVVLNLMPLKIATETDLIRLLSNSPLQLSVSFMRVKTHANKHTPEAHMKTFYRDFEMMREERFDGMIITGAPVEHLAFEEVDYWEEITKIFAWSRTHVTSTIYLCWAAQAGLYYYYGIPKYPLNKKMFGIFTQIPLQPKEPIFRGFDSSFNMPHSRYTELHREDILGCSALSLLAEGQMCGVSMVMARNGREIYVTGHSEYAPETLDEEYHRDKRKGLNIERPYNYYVNDDPAQGINITWRTHGNMLFQNWLNYYVYQLSP